MRAAVALVAMLTLSDPVGAQNLAKEACRDATNEAMQFADGIWNSDDRAKILSELKFGYADGIGGAMFLILVQLRADKVLRHMTTDERKNAAYRICLEVFTPYYKLRGVE